MNFFSLPQRIPFSISGRPPSSAGAYSQTNIQYDYAVGGIPFLSGTSEQRPDTETPIEVRKQQFENFEDPGEFSLLQWWLRSQTSFIGGAGIIYQDPDTQGQHKNLRFAKSIGVDPFTNVDFLLLQKQYNNATTLNNFTGAQGPAYVEGVSSTLFGDICFIAQGTRWDVQPVGASDIPSASPMNMAPTANASSILAGGMEQLSDTGQQTASAYVFLNDTNTSGNVSGVYRLQRNAIGLPTSIRQYVVSTGTSLGNPGGPGNYNSFTVGKGRGSILLGIDNLMYVLDPYAAAGSALPTVSAQVPKGQTIVSFTDGPDAIYVAANGFDQGYVYKTTVDATTGVVNGLQLTAVMPDGELISDAQAYVNTFLLVTTSSGIRLGTFTPGFSGAILNYGINFYPIPRSGLFGGPEGGSGFGRIAFYGSRAYIATQGVAQHDGSYGLVAVDLSTTVQDVNNGATFPSHATWDYVPGTTAAIMDVTVSAKGRPISTTGLAASALVQMEDLNNYISSGYMETGRCRFNTMEPKLFKFLSVRVANPLQGNIDVTLLDDTGGQTPYVTYGPTFDPGTGDMATPTPGGPRNWEAFRFTLHRGATDPTIAAALDAWQIKAIPGVIRQRKIVRNLQCFNHEQDKTGQLSGGDTYALDRLTQIRQMCQREDTVTLQDLAQNISTQVIIDDYAFTMTAPPGPNKENYGGYLTLTMRTVADSVPPTPPGVG